MKEIFLSSRCHLVGPFTYIQKVIPIVDPVILYPAMSQKEERSVPLLPHILGAPLL